MLQKERKLARSNENWTIVWKSDNVLQYISWKVGRSHIKRVDLYVQYLLGEMQKEEY